MSAFNWPLPPPSDEAEMLSMFSLSGPLPPVSSSECPEHFLASEEAHEHYVAYRLREASSDTRVFHANCADQVAGFIAFSMKEERHAASLHVFPSVGYVHVLPRFKRHGMTMLLPPLLEEIQSVLNQVKIGGKLKGVRIHVATHFESDGKAKFFEAFTSQLRALARKHHGVTLMS